MSNKTLVASLIAASLCVSTYAHAQPTEITFWHAMSNTLGDWVNDLTKEFNEKNPKCHLTSTFKGTYDQTMTTGIAAQRANKGPNILQVYEVGTATMMHSNGAIIPVAKLMESAGYKFDPHSYIPAVYAYYSKSDGSMVSFPFNSSTTVMYVNLDLFKKAGLPTDKDQLPKTWAQVVAATKALKKAGVACPITSSWVSWTQLESFSLWHNHTYASKKNGFGGLDARLNLTDPIFQRHMGNLEKMAKEGLFVYKGRGSSAGPAFYSGECAVIFGSSGLLSNIRRNAKFEYATLPLPYYADVPNAPQNTAIGGASLWALAGKSKAENACVADFFNFLSDPKVQASNHMRTGYLPITKKAYELTRESGYYEKNPGAAVPVNQMMKTTDKTRGIRLGNLPAIRLISDEELEKVWSGQQSAKQALENIKRRGDEQLERFERMNK